MGSFGLTEIILLFLIILILFGSKKIPDLFRAVGSSIKNYKSGISDEENTENQENKKIHEIHENQENHENREKSQQ